MPSAAGPLHTSPKFTGPSRPYATDINQLISGVKEINLASLVGPSRNDRVRSDYAYKVLDMCTYEPTSRTGDVTASRRRELFLRGQSALQTMEVMLNLHFPAGTNLQLNLELTEQRVHAIDLDTGTVSDSLSGEQRERAQRARAALKRLKVLDLHDPERFFAGTCVLKCATGAEVGWTVGVVDTAVLPTMPEPVHSAGDAWTEMMWVLAVASLIEMAKGLCACYGGQSIALGGARIPVECFEANRAIDAVV